MRVPAVTAPGAGLLASAVALRWSRPDLTAALAEHVGEMRAGDDRTWVAAAGWLVHGRAAIGDGRECASDALAEIARRGRGLLDDPAADRLRIEIASLAAGQCEPAMARSLVAPVIAADRSADVRADAYGVLARCVVEERPAAIGEATRRAEVAWSEMGGADADIASAALALISAAALRRSGHPDSAVDHAAEGLARLDEIRAAQDSAPSRHLAAALAAEWITALVEAGRTDDAREACAPMAQQLRKTARPTRQIALLRLAVARAVAESASAAAVEALEQAAQDAAACDTPDLEGLCLSTLGALREQAGRLDAALESMRRGVAAQRRDRARSERFREALRSMSLGAPIARTEVVPPDRTERTVGTLTRKQLPDTAVADDENSATSVHPLADARAVDPWSSGSWVDRPAVPAAIDGGHRGRRPSRARASEVGAAESDDLPADLPETPLGSANGEVPLVMATGDNAARLGFDGVIGKRLGIGVVRGVSSADEAGADGAASGSVQDEGIARDAGEGPADSRSTGVERDDAAMSGGRHAGGTGREAASPSTGIAASRQAAEQGREAERARQVSLTAPDPLFGPIEQLADDGADDGARRDGSADGGVGDGADEVAHPQDSVDLLSGSPAGDGRIAEIPVAHEERPARAVYEGERWLEAALAELDRVWGQPLPDLHEPSDPRAEPEHGAAVEAPADGWASSESMMTGRAAHSGTIEPASGVLASKGSAGSQQAAARPTATDAGVELPTAGGHAAERLAGEGRGAHSHAADGRARGVGNDGRGAGGQAADKARFGVPWPDLGPVSPLADNRVADEIGADGGEPAAGPVGGRAAVAPDAVGCVVVVDLVRAGTPVSEVGGLLREVSARMTRRIPAGARLRGEADGSALSVVLSGRERSVAIDWMHQTLPAIFAEVADLDSASPWATGTALRAAVHGTDGPVGAQLLQRVDLTAPQADLGRARHDPPSPPPQVIRWGVPILAGSGGRRRKPDAGHSTEVAGDDRSSNWQAGEAAQPEPARPEPGRPEVARSEPVRSEPVRSEAVRSEAVRSEPLRPEPVRPEGARPEDGERAGSDAGRAEPVSAERPGKTPDAEEAGFSVEGLGLADLLAGALAAYRGI